MDVDSAVGGEVGKICLNCRQKWESCEMVAGNK